MKKSSERNHGDYLVSADALRKRRHYWAWSLGSYLVSLFLSGEARQVVTRVLAGVEGSNAAAATSRGLRRALIGGLGRLAILNRAPDPLGRRRHVHMGHAEFAQRIDDGVDDCGQRRRCSALATGTHTERVGGRRDLHQGGGERWQRVGTGHGVVHERAGHHLT